MSSKNDEKYHYSEVVNKFEDLDNAKLFDDCAAEIQKLICNIKRNYRNKESVNFALGLFVKYVYSCLIDADRLDAYLYEVKGKYKPVDANWTYLINTFEKNISEFKSDNDINRGC